MIAHFNVEQQTEEWFRLKWAKIGGTRAKQLFVKTDTLLIDLLAEVTEPFDMDYEGYTSDDMQRGIELEPVARRAASKYIGKTLIECGWLESESNPLFGISVDGITADFKTTAEIKCPGAKRHLATCLNDEIPLDNIDQSIHYFTVNKHCEEHYFISFRPESIKPMFVKRLTRDSLVNIGTKSKPVMVSVQSAVDKSKKREVELQKEIKESINKLKF